MKATLDPQPDALAREREEYEKVLWVYGFCGVGLFSATGFGLLIFDSMGWLGVVMGFFLFPFGGLAWGWTFWHVFARAMYLQSRRHS